MLAHTAVYKRLTVWVGFPVVLALAAYNIKVELDHARSGHHEEKADYEAFNVRTKAFPFVVRSSPTSPSLTVLLLLLLQMGPR